jgi:dipeptidyl-peptidase-4
MGDMNVLGFTRLTGARSSTLAMLCLLASAPPVVAQDAGNALTVERIYGGSELEEKRLDVQWMADGRYWTTVEQDAEGSSELWRVEASTGLRQKLISAVELVPDDASEPIAIEGHRFSEDGRRALIFTNSQQVWRQRTRGRYYVFDFVSRRLIPVSTRSGWQMFAKFSPSADRVAFVRDHDLFVTDLPSGEERRLTFDGSETIINGTTDWVYEEELRLRDAFRWSPDGQRIAYWQLDQSPVRLFPLVDQAPLYPELTRLRYPKAGEANSRVRVGSLELSTGHTMWFDIGPETDIYIARMEWAESAHEVVVQRLNRHQNRLDLLLGNAHTGETSLLFSEEDDAWVDANDDIRWIAGGSHFTWTSDRDGYRHVYLYHRSGRLVRQLTRGNWDVTAFHGVDEEKGRAFFTAASESPLTRTVGSVSLEGTDPRTLAGGRGVHAANFNDSFELFVDTHSTIGTPPMAVLRRADDGSEVRILEDDAELRARLEGLDLREPEFFTLEAADGSLLNAYIIKPRDFDPGQAHPLLLYVYGGPGSQTVLDAWGGARYLWHQMLVRKGILVASVDNRGTGARGRAFKKQVYLRLGQMEAADQLAAVRELGEHPYVDASRVAIWGWSYGGYMTVLTSLLSEGAIKAAVAVTPVVAWELYDTIYTERYMRPPAENPEGYRLGSPLTYADRLATSLLLIHGTADYNVHPQNTMRMVSALEEAGKQFRMRLYPGQRHGFAGSTIRVNLYRLVTDFLLDELAGAEEKARSFGGLITAP